MLRKDTECCTELVIGVVLFFLGNGCKLIIWLFYVLVDNENSDRCEFMVMVDSSRLVH